jgi:hypothetical protein
MPNASYERNYEPPLNSLEELIDKVAAFFPDCSKVFSGNEFAYSFDENPEICSTPSSQKTKYFSDIKEFFSSYQKLSHRSCYFELSIKDKKELETKATIEIELFESPHLNRSLSIDLRCDDESKSKEILCFLDSNMNKKPNTTERIRDQIKRIGEETPINRNENFLISKEMIDKLRLKQHPKLNYSRLVVLLGEINSSWNNGNYNAVALLIRTVMNHIPPAFGFKKFEKVANNPNFISSVNKALGTLQNSMKHLADIIAHEQISEKEPRSISGVEVDCRQSLKLLLDEILRKTD